MTDSQRFGQFLCAYYKTAHAPKMVHGLSVVMPDLLLLLHLVSGRLEVVADCRPRILLELLGRSSFASLLRTRAAEVRRFHLASVLEIDNSVIE